MINKNFLNMWNFIIAIDGSYLIHSAFIKSLDGEIKSIYRRSYDSQSYNMSMLNAAVPSTKQTSISNLQKCTSYLFLGTGKTAPTVEDYNLESPIEYSTTGLNALNLTILNKTEYDTLKTMILTVRNDSEEDISDISEIGYFVNADLDDNKNQVLMLARETFDPVTIKAGETKSFTLTITL